MTPSSAAPGLLALLRRRAGSTPSIVPRPRSRFEDERPGDLQVVESEHLAEPPAAKGVRESKVVASSGPAPAAEPRPAPRPPRGHDDRPADVAPVRGDRPSGGSRPGSSSAAPRARLGPPQPRASGPSPDAPDDVGHDPVLQPPHAEAIAVAQPPASPTPLVARHLEPQPREPRPSADPLPAAGVTPAPGPPTAGPAGRRVRAAGPAGEAGAPVRRGDVEVRIGRIVVDARPEGRARVRRGDQGHGRVAAPGPDLETYLAGDDGRGRP